MAKTIQQILGYNYLLGLVEDITTGIPDVLPPAFWNTTASTVGNTGTYVRFAGTRKTSRRVEYGAPSLKRELQPIGTFPVILNHTFEHSDIPVVEFQALRAYTDYRVQQKGLEEVDRQALQFRTLFDNTRRAMVYSMLGNGAIWWDANGNLLPSSSGALVTIDYGIGANNKNQLNGIIAASWATATTDIPSHLRAIRKTARRLTGIPLRYAFYGQNIPSYLTANNFVKDFLARAPQYRDPFLESGEVPDGLFGFRWVPVYEAFFEDQNGNQQAIFGDDNITFTPEINSQVYELIEGTYPVPTTFQPLAGWTQAAGSFDLIQGMFAYALAIQDPMTARIYGGDTVLPVWKVPDSIFIADTVP